MKRLFRCWGFVSVAVFALGLLPEKASSQQVTSTDGAEAVAPIEGDYNLNGVVEQADLDLVLLHWGQDVTSAPIEDWTNDLPTGIIDQEELDGVLLNWGNQAATPEPHSLWLLLAAAVGALGLWRRRGNHARVAC